MEEFIFLETPLTTITIPKSVTQIGVGAFGKTALTTLEIPENVTQIGGLGQMDNLTTLTLRPTIPPQIDNSLLQFTTKIEHIYVPATSATIYKNAEVWKNYAHLIKAIP